MVDYRGGPGVLPGVLQARPRCSARLITGGPRWSGWWT